MECLSFRPSSILAGIQPSVPASVRPCPGRQSQESFLRGKNAEDKFEEINQILKGRGLQIAYLTEIPVFVVSAVTTVQSNHPLLLIAIAGAALLVVLLTSPKVFLSPATYIAGTKFPEKERTGWAWRLLAKADLTQAELYSLLLAGLNVILLIVIAISLPPK